MSNNAPTPSNGEINPIPVYGYRFRDDIEQARVEALIERFKNKRPNSLQGRAIAPAYALLIAPHFSIPDPTRYLGHFELIAFSVTTTVKPGGDDVEVRFKMHRLEGGSTYIFRYTLKASFYRTSGQTHPDYNTVMYDEEFYSSFVADAALKEREHPQWTSCRTWNNGVYSDRPNS